MAMKGTQAKHESQPAEFYSSSQYEAISKSLDDFCKLMTDKITKKVYQQVCFTE